MKNRDKWIAIAFLIFILVIPAVTVVRNRMPQSEKQLSDEELAEELRKIISQVGATSAKEMGKVMGVASKALAGRADGRAISAKVKELLA